MSAFKRDNPDCPHCNCPTSSCGFLCVTVFHPCSGNFATRGYAGAGSVVTVKQGSTVIGTCTTDASSRCCIAIPSAGTYTFEATVPPGKLHVTDYPPQSITLPCGTTNVGADLVLETGYQCQGNGCCGVSGPPPYLIYDNSDFPNTLYLNDGIGTVTLSRIGTGLAWIGTATRTAAKALVCGSSGTSEVDGATVGLTFYVVCEGQSGWTIRIGYSGCIVPYYGCVFQYPCQPTGDNSGPLIPVNQDPTCVGSLSGGTSYGQGPPILVPPYGSMYGLKGETTGLPPCGKPVVVSQTGVVGGGWFTEYGGRTCGTVGWAMAQVYGYTGTPLNGSTSIPITVTS
jgi:hypothetical protein